MTVGRRPVFFVIVVVICLALVPPTPAEFRWVNFSMAILSGFWAVALAIEDIALTRRHERGGPAP